MMTGNRSRKIERRPISQMTGAQFARWQWDESYLHVQWGRSMIERGLQCGDSAFVRDGKMFVRLGLDACRRHRAEETEAETLQTAAPVFNPYLHAAGGILQTTSQEMTCGCDDPPPWLEDLDEDDRIGHPTCEPIPAAMFA